VRAPVDDEHAFPELGSRALGNGQAEESGADDEEVETSGHRLLRVSDRAALTPFGEATETGFGQVATASG